MQPPYPPGAPYPPQQQAPVKQGLSGCAIAAIVVVVLMVLVIPVFAALSIYGVRRYLASAKTAEAKNTVGAVARAAAAAYERESMVGTKVMHRLCDSALPVPTSVPAGRKYQPSSTDFDTGTPDAGWKCLKFSLSYPTYYQHRYEKGAGSGKSGGAASGFEASAVGDLDGNGKTSLFARSGVVRNDQVVLSTELYIENEFE